MGLHPLRRLLPLTKLHPLRKPLLPLTRLLLLLTRRRKMLPLPRGIQLKKNLLLLLRTARQTLRKKQPSFALSDIAPLACQAFDMALVIDRVTGSLTAF